MPTLRPYQQEDIDQLKHLDSAGIFNDMRTGKTPTTLKLLETKNFQKNIIVCPGSMLYKWKDEYTLWLNKPCICIDGATIAKREKQLKNWTHGLIISYDTFKPTPDIYDKETGEFKKNGRQGMLAPILAQNPDCIILDEAHRIKNYKSATAKAAFQCLRIPHRYALTGTPAPNKNHEIWSILHFLKPKEFAHYWPFINKFFQTQTQFTKGNTFIDIGDFKPLQDTVLQSIIKDFTIQRKRTDVMPWLPKKEYMNIRLPLTKEQNKYLSELKKYFETEHIVCKTPLDRLTRYRQICNAPEILDLKGNSPKIDWILQYIKDYPDQQILIFSKFVSFINLLRAALFQQKIICKRITGNTSPADRQWYINDFQRGTNNLLIMQIDTCKEGITLDRAETIIFADKYPPLADVQQAEDRFVATTPDKANKPHTIINLMMADSYDEKLYTLIEQRMSETDILNNYNAYMKGGE